MDIPNNNNFLAVNNQLNKLSLSPGSRQSPIDLAYQKDCQSHYFDDTLKHEPLTFNYNTKDICVLQNSGTTFRMGVTKNSTSNFQAGHLKRDYKLLEMHGHWGSDRTNGSEHTINGQGYAAEIHFVHWNTSYESVEVAKEHEDGLAVVGVFLQETEVGDKSLNPLVSLLQMVSHKGDQITLPKGFDLTQLIPKCQDFWTYDGSLTTPPYTECVIWTIIKTPLAISSEQISAMRDLSAVPATEVEEHHKYNILNNVRAVQHKAERVVKTSFTNGNY